MQIIKSDYKKGFVKLKVENVDDLWYLSHLIDPEDHVRGTTTRKIKIGDNENAKVVKKTVTLTIEVEKTEFVAENNILRINGKITNGPEDFPRGSYQNISLEEGIEFTLEKSKWLKFQKEKLKEASEKSYSYLICLFDREESLFALSKKSGYQILTRIKSDLPKKGDPSQAKEGKYYQDIIKNLSEYQERYNSEKIILASPAFYREDLLKLVKDSLLKEKIVSVLCNSVTQTAIEEVMRRPELKDALKESRNRTENLLVEELLTEISKEGLYSYGPKEVQEAINAGAVTKLLISDKYIHKKRLENDYQELDAMLKVVDKLKGDIHIISSDHDPGKKLDGLGGIAAILRYKI